MTQDKAMLVGLISWGRLCLEAIQEEIAFDSLCRNRSKENSNELHKRPLSDATLNYLKLRHEQIAQAGLPRLVEMYREFSIDVATD